MPTRTSSEPVEIVGWLASIGFESEAALRMARRVLEAAGLTNPRKRAMSPEKLPRARAALEAALQLLCESCARHSLRRDGRIVVETQQAFCDICAGSNNRRAVEAMVAACRRAGVSRLLIVGGTSAIHRELSALLAGARLDLRCIDGAERAPNRRDALADLNWAEFMVVWGSTPLPHSVSTAYTDQCPADLPSITIRRRGIEALCTEVTYSLARR